MNFKKKALSTLVATSMVLSMVPMSLAAGYNESVGGVVKSTSVKNVANNTVDVDIYYEDFTKEIPYEGFTGMPGSETYNRAVFVLNNEIMDGRKLVIELNDGFTVDTDSQDGGTDDWDDTGAPIFTMDHAGRFANVSNAGAPVTSNWWTVTYNEDENTITVDFDTLASFGEDTTYDKYLEKNITIIMNENVPDEADGVVGSTPTKEFEISFFPMADYKFSVDESAKSDIFSKVMFTDVQTSYDLLAKESDSGRFPDLANINTPLYLVLVPKLGYGINSTATFKFLDKDGNTISSIGNFSAVTLPTGVGTPAGNISLDAEGNYTLAAPTSGGITDAGITDLVNDKMILTQAEVDMGAVVFQFSGTDNANSRSYSLEIDENGEINSVAVAYEIPQLTATDAAGNAIYSETTIQGTFVYPVLESFAGATATDVMEIKITAPDGVNLDGVVPTSLGNGVIAAEINADGVAELDLAKDIAKYGAANDIKSTIDVTLEDSTASKTYDVSIVPQNKWTIGTLNNATMKINGSDLSASDDIFTDIAELVEFKATIADDTKVDTIKMEISAIDPATGNFAVIATSDEAVAEEQEINFIPLNTTAGSKTYTAKVADIDNSYAATGVEFDTALAQSKAYKVSFSIDENVVVNPSPSPSSGSGNDYYYRSSSNSSTISLAPSYSVNDSSMGRVSIKSDNKTVTISPYLGYRIADVIVNGQSVGAVETYVFDKVARSNKIEVVFEVDPNYSANTGTAESGTGGYTGGTSTGTSTGMPFTDVNTSDWFYQAVAYVYSNGLFSGTSDTAFSPNTPMTRAMLVTVLHRLNGAPAVAPTTAYTDVDSGTWYTTAVAWAEMNNIVAGVGGTSFAPNDNVTREQMARILHGYDVFVGGGGAVRGDISGFVDGGQVADWAQESVSWAVGSGLMSGKGENNLDPKGNATRAEVASILQRYEGF